MSHFLAFFVIFRHWSIWFVFPHSPASGDHILVLPESLGSNLLSFQIFTTPSAIILGGSTLIITVMSWLRKKEGLVCVKSLPYLRGLCMVSRTLVPQPFILHVHPLPSLPNFLLTLPGSAYKCSPTPNLTLLNGILSLSRHGLFVQKGSITPRAPAGWPLIRRSSMTWESLRNSTNYTGVHL